MKEAGQIFETSKLHRHQSSLWEGEGRRKSCTKTSPGTVTDTIDPLNLSWVRDQNGCCRFSIRIDCNTVDLIDHIHALYHLPKDDELTVQLGDGVESDEKLRTRFPSACRRQEAPLQEKKFTSICQGLSLRCERRVREEFPLPFHL